MRTQSVRKESSGEDREAVPRNEIGDDEPLRLKVAAARAFPDGSMTVSGLRREAARGRLALERIAGKDYTTLGAIKAMRRLCHSAERGHGFGCNLQMDASEPLGSSATESSKSALASARTTLKRLSEL